jgi:transposase
MSKPLGSKNFSRDEGERLAELAAQGLSKTEAAKALHRSYWTVMRHSLKLGILFEPRKVTPPISKAAARTDLTEPRARRRQLEDALIQEFARNGWTSGRAALELDLDQSLIWRHSKRLGVKWIRYHNRSVTGTRVSGLAELRRLRAQVRRLSQNGS